MEIVIKTILWQIITHYAGTQDIIKKLASCDPCGRKSGLKTVAELLRLSICAYVVYFVHRLYFFYYRRAEVTGCAGTKLM